MDATPPKSAELGRWGIALTCFECNNRGHSNEANLAEYLRSSRFLRERKLERRPILMSKGEIPIRALLEVDGSKGKIMVPSGDNDPKQIRRFNEADSDPRGMRWKIPFKFEGQLVELAYLKAAYVAAFACFGYRYVFGVPTLNAVRKELDEPTGTISGFVGRWTDTDEPRLRLLVCPKPLPTLVVEIGVHTVALPWFGSGTDFYERLAETMKSAGPQQFGYSRIEEWPKTLVLKEDFQREPPDPGVWVKTV